MALDIGRGAGADLQHGIGLQEGGGAGNLRIDRAHQLPGHRLDRRALRRIFQKGEQEALIAGQKTGIAGHGEGHVHGGIGVQRLFGFLLVGVHLVGRRAFLRDHDAADERAVADRQERFRHGVEQIARANQANHPDERRNPAMAQEEPERAAVEVQHAALDAADHALHPGLLVLRRRAATAGASTSAASASARRCRWRRWRR